MKRNFIIIFWALSMVILVACTNENDSEVDYNNTSVSEEGTYETITSQKNTESQEETEEIPVTQTETEEASTELPDIKFTPGVEEAMSVPDEGLSLMQKVLLNKAEFWGEPEDSYNDEPMEKHVVDDYFLFCDYRGENNYFYVVDLDKDGKKEVCVTYRAGKMMIFHEENGEVYGYEYAFRSMNPLYEDGTFRGSGGAAISYLYGNVSFSGNVFSRETITSTWFETSGKQHFYKGEPYFTDQKPGIEISQEEYDEIMAGYTKEEAKEYDFTIENILKYVE